MSLKILGIDPGYARLGWCVISQNDEIKYLDGGCILTNKNDHKMIRYKQIYDNICNIIKTYKINVLGIEDLYFSINTKTALNVAESRGIIYLCSAQNNLKVIEISPNKVKSMITGYGHSTKEQIEFMVKNQIKFNSKVKYDDYFDAIAVALATSYLYEFDNKVKIS